jgi:excisionase family DNA binding protein
MPERDKPWSTKELAEAAGVNDSYIRQLLIAGDLKGFKIGQRTWAIPAEVGQEWLDKRKQKQK